MTSLMKDEPQAMHEPACESACESAQQSMPDSTSERMTTSSRTTPASQPLIQRHIPPQSGTSLILKRGEILRIIDPSGEQVSDLMAFSQHHPAEWLSSGRTIDYANTIYLTTGHVLYSNRSKPMLTIMADTVGRHDFLLTPCSAETFQIIYNNHAHHPSCFQNLVDGLSMYGITPDQIPTTFNIFMNVMVADNGELTIAPPRSKAGDYIELRAEMDLIVGVTACSAELSNNYRFKPIDIEVHAAPASSAEPA